MAVSAMTTARQTMRAGRPSALLAVEIVVGLTAFVCGIALIVDGLGIPREELAGTPFDSFLIPDLLLSLVVGGSLLTAAWLVWQRHPIAPLASLAAGCILLGWIVVEALMIDAGRVLQAIVFTVALLTIGLAWRVRQRVLAGERLTHGGRT